MHSPEVQGKSNSPLNFSQAGFEHGQGVPLKHKEIDRSIDRHVRGRDNTDITLCRVIHLSSCEGMIDSRRGFLSG